jgi:hypothetical protein
MAFRSHLAKGCLLKPEQKVESSYATSVKIVKSLDEKYAR